MTYLLTTLKLQSYRQCLKRLWLAASRLDLAVVGEGSKHRVKGPGRTHAALWLVVYFAQ